MKIRFILFDGTAQAVLRTSEDYHEGDAQARGKPDPEQFALDDGERPLAEELADADGRDLQGAEGEEVALAAEGREEGDAEPAVGQRVERRVRSGREREEDGERRAIRRVAEEDERQRDSHQQREDERVRKAAVAEHAVVRYAEAEGQDVRVRQDGA